MPTPKRFGDDKSLKAGRNAEARRQQALQRLGCDSPRCIRCGETDPRCLEHHHIAGQAYDGTLATLCRNCHRKASDMQRDHPPQVDDPPSLTERVGHFLLGLADLFALLIEVCRQFGHALIESCGTPAAEE